MVSEQTTPESVGAIRAALADLLRRNDYVVDRNTDGITTEQSLVRFTGGSSNLSWLLGHMTASRDACTRLLGAQPLWPLEHARRYGRGSEVPEDQAAEPIGTLRQAFHESGQLFRQALEAASEEQLSRPNPRNAEERIIDALFFLVWHDTYHAGQTALYRRQAGLGGVF